MAIRDRGLTQSAVARRAGLTQAFVSQLMSGARADISLASAIALAEALDLSIERPGRLRRARRFSVKRAQQWLLDPPSGSRAAAARDYGVDLTLNAGRLGVSVDQRVADMQAAAAAMDALRRAYRARRV